MGSIGDWLEHQRLGKYLNVLVENEIDWEVLPELTDADLKGIGIPLGPRKKLLKAIRELDTSAWRDEAAADIVADAAHVGPAERRQITVMFCDLVGSVGLAERMDVEDFRGLLAAFRAVVVGAIGDLDGFIARHQGDGILAYFGYPVARENDAERAVRAGLRTVGAVAALEHPYPAKLQVRIGIATGPAVVGDVLSTGSSERSELVALGSTPNLAARLQGISQPNGVVISAATQRLAGRFFRLRARDPIPLKGLDNPVSSFEVLGERSHHTASELLAASFGLPSLVGRRGELALLMQRWEHATAGAGQTVLVSAEPGVGKTRLVREAREQIRGLKHAHSTVILFCSPYHSGSALHPVAEALGRALRFEPNDSPEARLGKLESFVQELDLQNTAAVPLLANLFLLPFSEPYSMPEGSAELQRRLTLEVLVEVFERLTAKRAVLLLAEDLHWSDPTTLVFLSLVTERSRAWRLLALLTFRPEFEVPWRDRAHLTTLTLNHLTHDESRTLARSVASSQLSDELLAGVIERAGGVPLYIEELARTVAESTAEANGGAQIPETLRDALTARLDRLGKARPVAQLASIIGRVFSLELLHRLYGGELEELRRALDSLEGSGLIKQGRSATSPSYEFKHALVQEAAYSSLLRETRFELHGHLAEVLEETRPELRESQPEVFARHYAAANMTERAIGYWRSAGERAGRQSAHMEAVTHFRSALQALETLPSTRDRRRAELELQMLFAAEQQMVLGQTSDEVKEVYIRAAGLAEEFEPTASWPVPFGLWRLHTTRAEFREGLQYRDQLAELAGKEINPLLEAAVRIATGATAFFLGRPSEAVFALDASGRTPSVEELRSLTLLTGMPVALSFPIYLNVSRWLLGHDTQARQGMHELEDTAREQGRPYELGMVLLFVSVFRAMCRDPDGAIASAAECVSIADRHHFPMWGWLSSCVAGWSSAMQGDPTAGINNLKQGLAAQSVAHARLLRPFVLSLLAEAFERAGDFESARKAIDQAYLHANETGECWWMAETLRRSGLILLAEGSAHDEVLKQFKQSMEVARAQNATTLELRAALSAARLHKEAGQKREARTLLTIVNGSVSASMDCPEVLECRELLATLT